MNANQVFSWRRLYRQGQLERRAAETPGLLPVRVIGATVREAARSKGTRRTPSGMMHVEFAKGQLRIAGCDDAGALRIVLEKSLG